MAVQIWFTSDDLARTRVAAPDPLAETLFSLIPLREGRLPGWRQRTRRRLTRASRHLGGMVPARPMLDLVTVAGRTATVAEGLGCLLSAPRVLDAEVASFAREHAGVPQSLRPLLDTRRGAHHDLVRAVSEYHEIAVAPYWPRLSVYLQAQRERAGRSVLDGGIADVFAGLSRYGVRWESPVLEVPSAVAGRPGPPTICHLGGRGLLLVPSMFFGPYAVLFRDIEDRQQTMLVYPAAPEPQDAVDLWSSPDDRTLAALLGTSRARVLAVADGCTTTELARRVGLSPSSASEHARALRKAGLLRTVRRGPEVAHTVTDLGLRLLDHRPY